MSEYDHDAHEKSVDNIVHGVPIKMGSDEFDIFFLNNF